jgi:hypothetical protein
VCDQDAPPRKTRDSIEYSKDGVSDLPPPNFQKLAVFWHDSQNREKRPVFSPTQANFGNLRQQKRSKLYVELVYSLKIILKALEMSAHSKYPRVLSLTRDGNVFDGRGPVTQPLRSAYISSSKDFGVRTTP